MASQKREFIVAAFTAISVGIITYQLIYDISQSTQDLIYAFDLIVTAILFIDFYLRMRESRETNRIFILKHLYEIPALIPLVVFGIFENYSYLNVVFRLLRLIRLFRIIHLSSRILSISSQTNNRLIYIILVSVMAVTSGALGLYFVEEQAPGSKVTNLGDAFWWAIVTVTTVGYGDIYPVTAEGKIIASILMVVGIGILGVLISTLGGSFIESRLKPKVNNIEEDTKKKINEKINKLELLNKDEFSFLITSITTLYTDLNRQKQKRNETLSCLKCKNICPENSKFCNICGYLLTNNY